MNDWSLAMSLEELSDNSGAKGFATRQDLSRMRLKERVLNSTCISADLMVLMTVLTSLADLHKL